MQADAAERARLVARLPQVKAAAQRLVSGAFRRDGERLPRDREPHFSIPFERDDDDALVIRFLDDLAALLEADGLAGETEREKVAAFLRGFFPPGQQAEHEAAYRLALGIEMGKHLLTDPTSPPVRRATADQIDAGLAYAEREGAIHNAIHILPEDKREVIAGIINAAIALAGERYDREVDTLNKVTDRDIANAALSEAQGKLLEAGKALEAIRDAQLTSITESLGGFAHRLKAIASDGIALIRKETEDVPHLDRSELLGGSIRGDIHSGDAATVATSRRATAEQVRAFDRAAGRFINEGKWEAIEAGLNAALAFPEPATSPVAWRVKDFADGWILCWSKNEAEHQSREMSGALIEPLYAAPVAPPEPAASPVVWINDWSRRIIWGSEKPSAAAFADANWRPLYADPVAPPALTVGEKPDLKAEGESLRASVAPQMERLRRAVTRPPETETETKP